MKNPFSRNNLQAVGRYMKHLFTDRDWWKGVFGSILATVIGIALTIGVAELSEYNNDKRLSREMIFTVVKTCEDDCFTIHSYDSIFGVHSNAILHLTNLYIEHDKDFTKIPVDSVQKYIDILFSFKVSERQRTYVESYFFSAQMMHQFNNTDLYSEFGAFIKRDQEVLEKIYAVKKQYDNITSEYFTTLYDDPNIKSGLQAFQKIMESHVLTSYRLNIDDLDLEQVEARFKHDKDYLLKVAGFTNEEYKEYGNSNDDIYDDVKGVNFKYSSKKDKKSKKKKKQE